MQLAQINIGRILAPMGSEVMREFEENLDHINALAENSPGFVWRLKEENNNATSIKAFDDDFILINMSVWQNTQSLFDYVYNSQHKEFLKRRQKWFNRMTDLHMALWYIEEGQYPSIVQAIERLQHIRKHGESPYAFSFRKRFTEMQYKSYLTTMD